MSWTLTESLDDHVANAGGFLRSRPVHHIVHLVVLESLCASGAPASGPAAPVFGWWRSAGGEVTAALLHTPPHPALLTRLPTNGTGHPAAAPAAAPVTELAEALAARGRPLPAVNAEQADAAAFAAAWSAVTGATWRISMRSRLYQLGRLQPPEPHPRGTARVATAADRDLAGSWLAGFAQELSDISASGPDLADDLLSHGALTLWETDRAAVSLAGVHRTEGGTVRVGPVYTPPEHRRLGYAGAVTAAVSQAALDAGASHVVLSTDQENPTTNGLYLRLGYRPVEDHAVLRFTS
jgi:GNAT superfamily N-acetyltransferase